MRAPIPACQSDNVSIRLAGASRNALFAVSEPAPGFFLSRVVIPLLSFLSPSAFCCYPDATALSSQKFLTMPGDSPAISPPITGGRAVRGVRLRRGGRCASARHEARPRPVMVMASFASRRGAAPARQMSGLGRAFAILGAGAGPSAIRGKTASRPCPPLSHGVFPAARAARAGCERWAGGQNCDVRFTNTPRFGLSIVRRSSDTLPQR